MRGPRVVGRSTVDAPGVTAGDVLPNLFPMINTAGISGMFCHGCARVMFCCNTIRSTQVP